MANSPGFRVRRNEQRDVWYLRPDVSPPVLSPPVLGWPVRDWERPGNAPPQASDDRLDLSFYRRDSRSKGGFRLRTWYDYFWRNRVHVIDPSFAAGRVLSAIENSFEIYNAGETTRDRVTLVTFSQDGTTGITLDAGTITPFTLGAGVGETYEYTVTTSGPPNIEASYTFDFGQPADSIHRITGTRLTPFTWQPQRLVRETWQWNTAVLQGASGYEQRIATRNLPTEAIEYTFRFTEAQRARLEAVLWEWSARIFGVPVWMDARPLAADAAIGDLVLSVGETANYSFRVGDLVLLLSDDTTFEVGTIDAIAATTVTLDRPLVQAWSAGALVLPVREALLRDVTTVTDENVKVSTFSITFDSVESREDPSTAGFSTYRGQPLWDDTFVTSGQTERTLDIGLVRGRVDRSHGRVSQYTFRDRTTQRVTGIRVVAQTRAELWRLKRWFWALRGQQGVFWMPSGREDFVVVIAQPSAGVELTVRLAYWARFTLQTPAGRRDIRITYTDGAQDLRRIVTATESGGNDVLELDAATSRVATPANVAKIEYLFLRRLATDRIRFDHSRQNQVVVNVPLQDATDDV